MKNRFFDCDCSYAAFFTAVTSSIHPDTAIMSHRIPRKQFFPHDEPSVDSPALISPPAYHLTNPQQTSNPKTSPGRHTIQNETERHHRHHPHLRRSPNLNLRRAMLHQRQPQPGRILHQDGRSEIRCRWRPGTSCFWWEIVEQRRGNWGVHTAEIRGGIGPRIPAAAHVRGSSGAAKEQWRRAERFGIWKWGSV